MVFFLSQQGTEYVTFVILLIVSGKCLLRNRHFEICIQKQRQSFQMRLANRINSYKSLLINTIWCKPTKRFNLIRFLNENYYPIANCSRSCKLEKNVCVFAVSVPKSACNSCIYMRINICSVAQHSIYVQYSFLLFSAAHVQN